MISTFGGGMGAILDEGIYSEDVSALDQKQSKKLVIYIIESLYGRVGLRRET